MPVKSLRKPSYTLHKATGQARVRIDGKDHYLGLYGTPESREAYDDLITAWLSRQDIGRCRLTVADLALLYLAHARKHYRKDGQQTSEVHCIQLALRHLIAVHRRTLVSDFGPRASKQVRESMIEAGYVRTSINQHVSRIKRMFRWAVEEQIATGELIRDLWAVRGLDEGRSAAREADPVEAVPEAVVTATLPCLTSVLRAMVELQLLTGMRPGEVCTLRPADVVRSASIWVYTPRSHKTKHKGKQRRIFIGPRAQAILQPFLERDSDAYCFSPAESMAERTATSRRRGKDPRTVLMSSPRRIRERYTKDTYRRAIERGCERAFRMPKKLRNVAAAVRTLPVARRAEAKQRLTREAAEWRQEHCWSPNRLRHSRATILRERYGIEAARTVLGHSSVATTEVYAERDFAMAANIMAEIG